MVHIVMIGSSPERQEMVQAPRELVAAVRIDGLEETEDDPEVHGQDVEVLGEGAPEDRGADGSESEDHDFDRGGVFGCHAEGGRVLVVDLVDGFVEGSPVESAVGEVVPGVFHDEEDGDLVGHGPDGGEGDGGREAEVLCHRVEEPIRVLLVAGIMTVRIVFGECIPDLREFDGKVTKEDQSGAGKSVV